MRTGFVLLALAIAGVGVTLAARARGESGQAIRRRMLPWTRGGLGLTAASLLALVLLAGCGEKPQGGPSPALIPCPSGGLVCIPI